MPKRLLQCFESACNFETVYRTTKLITEFDRKFYRSCPLEKIIPRSRDQEIYIWRSGGHVTFSTPVFSKMVSPTTNFTTVDRFEVKLAYPNHLLDSLYTPGNIWKRARDTFQVNYLENGRLYDELYQVSPLGTCTWPI